MRELAGLIIAAGLLMAAPSLAQDKKTRSPAAPEIRAQDFSEFSSSQRKKTNKTTATVAASNPPRAVWTGPDPTKGPGIERIRQLQFQGRCVMDMGYGRFLYCM